MVDRDLSPPVFPSPKPSSDGQEQPDGPSEAEPKALEQANLDDGGDCEDGAGGSSSGAGLPWSTRAPVLLSILALTCPSAFPCLLCRVDPHRD